MKKSTRDILWGISTAAVGVMTYFLVKELAKPVEPSEDEEFAEEPSYSKEYVAYRRAIMRERAAAKAARSHGDEVTEADFDENDKAVHPVEAACNSAASVQQTEVTDEDKAE